MLVAIRNSDNNKVLGPEIEKDPKASYHCDFCKKEVIHHKSKSQVRIGHFKHKQESSDCLNRTNETLWHSKTKYDIFKYINEKWGKSLKVIEVEKWICQNKVRSDIYIETLKGNIIAIEVQATILTVSEIERRTSKYRDQNVAVLWILPFNQDRYWEYKVLSRGYNIYDTKYGYGVAEKVKFKEMEIWLYLAYLNKLIFWDLKHEYSEAFILVEFEDYINVDQEFRMDGEDHFYKGKPAKTLKSVVRIKYDVPFNELSIKTYPSCRVPQRNYLIPQRKIFS